MHLRMRRLALTLMILVVSQSHAAELGLAGGRLIVRGKETPLRFAYGKHASMPGAKSDVLILLTSDPLSESALQSESEQNRLIRSGQLSAIELHLAENMRPIRAVILQHDLPPVNLLNNIVRLDSTFASQRLIAATASYSGSDSSFVGEFRTRIGDGDHFAPNAAASAELESRRSAPAPQAATSVTAPISSLAPLPKGGGEPGTVFLAYVDAFRRGDMPAISKLSTARSTAEIEQIKELLPIARATLPMNIKVTKAGVNGNTATLQVRGTPTLAGAGSSGTVSMVKEGGAWKFDKWDWPAPSAAQVAQSEANVPRGVAPVTKGTPLPGDGGEPGKAWRAYDAAMNRGDVAAIKRTLLDEAGGQFDQAVPLLDLMRGSRGVNARVVGGVISGDKATLRLQGQPPTLAASTGNGSVTMMKEHGLWKMASEEWTPKK